MASEIQHFIATHSVFTWDEFKAALGESRTEHTLHTQIKYYLGAGRIVQVKRGLYYRPSREAGQTQPDKYVIGSKVAADAVLGYHTAFEALGYAHSVSSRVYVMTAYRRRPFSFQHVTYRPVSFPTVAGEESPDILGVEQINRAGESVAVTGKTRSLVDAVDRPEYMGGYEELRHCIEKLPYLDFEQLSYYLQRRGKKILYAKVGFLLEQFQEEWLVPDDILTDLESHTPQSPAYFGTTRTGKLMRRWNVIVPEILLKSGESS